MMYYRKSDIVERRYYKRPHFVKAEFEDIEFREILINSSDRLDIVAQRIYGNPNYWKALALFNGIEFGLSLQDNSVLRLPVRIEDLMSRI